MKPIGRPDTPFKGLVPYDEADAPFFFGRDPEREVITANLMGSRLTLLYGPSGAGKSSVLRAGVVHQLREMARREVAARGRPKFVPVFFNEWRDDPLAGLRAQLRRGVEGALGSEPDCRIPPGTALAEELKLWADCVGGKLLIVLDQFEEYFLYPQREGAGSFAEEFAQAVNRDDVRANFIVSLREDWLAKLDRFKVSIPTLFDNYLRVRWLDAGAARLAIEKPVAKYNSLTGNGVPAVRVAEGFSDKVIEQLSGLTRRGVLGDSGGAAGDGAADALIQTPYLQLVMRQLWAEALRADGRVLHPDMLKAPLDPGKAETRAEEIIQSHLDGVMGGLSAGEREVAARAFYYLVTPGGTKIALGVGDLAAFTDLPRERLEPVLEKLSCKETAVLSRLAPPPDHPQEFRYEIFHDVLAPAILAWRDRYLDERRKVEASAKVEKWVRRRMKGLGLGLAAAVIFAIVVTVLAADSRRKQLEAEAARSGLAEAQRELKKQYDEVETSRRELKDTNDALVKTQGELDQRVRDLNETNARLTSTRDALAAKVEEVNQSREDLATANATLQDTNDRLVSSNARLLGLQGEQYKLIAQLEATRRELETRNEQLQKAEGALRKSVGELSNTRDTLKRRNEQLLKTQEEAEELLQTVQANDRQVPYSEAVARPGGLPTAAALVGESNYLAGVSLAGPGGKTQVVYWDMADTRYKHERLAYAGLRSAALSADGRYVAASLTDRTEVLDCGALVAKADPAKGDAARQCAPVQTLSGAFGQFDVAAFDAGGTRLAVAPKEGKARVWNVASGRPTNLEGKADAVAGVAFSPDGRLVAGAGPDQIARVWDADTGRLVAELRGHTEAVTSVAFSPSGDQVVATGADGTAVVWQMPGGKGKGRVKAILREHRALIIKKKKGNFPLDFELTDPHRPKLNSAAFSNWVNAKGEFVVTGGDDGIVRIWDIKSNTEVRRMSGHNAPVRSVSFGPHGFIVSTGEDGTVRVWNPCLEVGWPRVDLDLIGVDSALNRFSVDYCGVKRVKPDKARD